MSGDDSTPAPEAFQPNEHPLIWYVAAAESEEVQGIFTFIPQNAVCFEVHAAILPAAWGPRSREALRGAIAWMFENSPARRIVASIPAYNRLAIKLGRDAGMKAFGRNRDSFLKNAVLHDQLLLGISKP